jgi:hypothetical protein
MLRSQGWPVCPTDVRRHRLRPPSSRVLRSRRRISCRSACRQAPSTGFSSKIRPSVDVTFGVHSTTTEAVSGDALPHAPHVPPSWVLTTLTVCSTESLPGLLHPIADPEVHRVSAPVQACRPWCQSVPTDATPSRAFPSAAAVLHVTVGRAPLPSPRPPLGVRGRLRGLHPRRSPWPCRDVAAVARLEALLGFPHLETCRRSPARPAEAGWVGSLR